MKITVDSNIIFSAILNTKSRIGQLLIDGSRYFDFYSVSLLKEEILSHKQKIIEITHYTEGQFNAIYQILISRIYFIDDRLLSFEELEKAARLVKDIDEDDALFIALNEHLGSELWTGDKKLINGLNKKGYTKLLTTDDLYKRFLSNQLKLK